MFAVPPEQISAGLVGWVVIAGSAATVTVTTFEVAVPQPSPVAETKHLYW